MLSAPAPAPSPDAFPTHPSVCHGPGRGCPLLGPLPNTQSVGSRKGQQGGRQACLYPPVALTYGAGFSLAVPSA